MFTHISLSNFPIISIASEAAKIVELSVPGIKNPGSTAVRGGGGGCRRPWIR